MNKTSILNFVTAFLLFWGIVGLSSCNKDKDKVEVTAVNLDPTSKTLTPGGKFSLVVGIEPVNATVTDVSWSSSDDGVIASIEEHDGYAVITAGSKIASATVTVITEDGGLTKSCTVTVIANQYPVESVSIAPGEQTIAIGGEPIVMTATVLPANATNKAVEFTSSDPSVVRVDRNTGEIEGLKCGSAVIVATTSDGQKTAEALISVNVPVTELKNSFTKDTVVIELQNAIDLAGYLAVEPADACNKTLKWEFLTSEPEFAKGREVVDLDFITGRARAMNTLGKAKVRVTSTDGAKTVTFIIKVVDEIVFDGGADFSSSKVVVYSFSNGNGGTIYPAFATAVDAVNAARVADMDDEYVLIAGRWDQCQNPHLLRIADLKAGNIEPIYLNMTQREGEPDDSKYGFYVNNGQYGTSYGRLVNGHVYLCNLTLSTNVASTVNFASSSCFRAFHWTTAATDVAYDPEDDNRELAFEIVKVWNEHVPFTDAFRVGDYMSVNLDANGNGAMYAAGSSFAQHLRIPITNFTETTLSTGKETGAALNILTPAGFTVTADGAGPWSCFNAIDEEADRFLYTGTTGPLRLLRGDGSLVYQALSFTNSQVCDAKIVRFNEGRYLVGMNDCVNSGKGVITVYDITKGDDTEAALRAFDSLEESKKAPKYEFSLDGTLPTGNIQVNIRCRVVDDKLYIIGGGNSIGFAIIEIPMVED